MLFWGIFTKQQMCVTLHGHPVLEKKGSVVTQLMKFDLFLFAVQLHLCFGIKKMHFLLASSLVKTLACAPCVYNNVLGVATSPN